MFIDGISGSTELCYALRDGHIVPELIDFGVEFPVTEIGEGHFSTCFQDANGHILRVSSEYTDKFIDDILKDAGYPILNSSLIYICEGQAFTVTLRKDIESLKTPRVSVTVDEFENSLMMSTMSGAARSKLLNKFLLLTGEYSDLPVGNVLEDVVGYEIDPEISIALVRDIRDRIINEDISEESLLRTHRKHYGFVYESVDLALKYGFVSNHAFTNDNQIKNGNFTVSAIVSLTKALRNVINREIIFQITECVLDFYEKTGLFPYDFTEENLGIHNDKIVIRDPYYIGLMYRDLESEWRSKMISETYKYAATGRGPK